MTMCIVLIFELPSTGVTTSTWVQYKWTIDEYFKF